MALLFLQDGRYLIVQNIDRIVLSQKIYRVCVFDVQTHQLVIESIAELVGISSDESVLLLKSDDNLRVVLIHVGTVVDYEAQYEHLFPAPQRMFPTTIYQRHQFKSPITDQSLNSLSIEGVIIEDLIFGDKVTIPVPTYEEDTNSGFDVDIPVSKLYDFAFAVFGTWKDNGWSESQMINFYDLSTHNIRFTAYRATNNRPQQYFTFSPHSMIGIKVFAGFNFYDVQSGLKLGKLKSELARSIVIHPHDKEKVILGLDGHLHYVRVDWNIESNDRGKTLQFELLEVVPSPIVPTYLRWSSDGNILAIANDLGNVSLFNVQTAHFEKLS